MDRNRFVRRDGDLFQAGWTAMIGIALIPVWALFSLAGCTPYPMYTHGTVVTAGPERPGETAPGSDGKARTTVASGRELESPSSVDPTIMSRIVSGYVGIAYRKGGDDEKGYDCSHLVRAVYRDYSGTRLPASTRALYSLPQDVPTDELAVGDLVFFSFDGSSVSHVGIYMGGGRFVHASESRGVVFSSLSDSEFRGSYKGARRVL